MFVAPKEASKYYQVTKETLRLWSEKGKVEFITTSGGHRRYKIKLTDSITKLQDRKSYIYARVSSRKQESDLKTQINYLQSRYPNHELITDIGSGINEKRKGYKALLEQVFTGTVKQIVVAHKDRLSRFSFDLFQSVCSKYGTKIIVAREEEDKNGQQELTDDLMSVITVFTARYYGKRKY